MTTDELLMKLPSHIGRNRINGFYLWDNQRNASIGWLYLHNDGKDWCASYGTEGHFVCLNPDAENHHIIMQFVMVKLLMKHYKDCIIGVLKTVL